MIRLSLWLLILALTASVVLGGGSAAEQRPSNAGMSVAGPIAALPGNALPVEDPFPIYRVRGNKADLPNILKPVESGPLVQLRRSEFEAQVRRASRFLAESRTTPRLSHARYRASLTASDLTGSAEMEIVNSSAVPQFLPFDPLRIALTRATWSDGQEAIVGIPAGGSPSVWVDRPGNQVLKFNWSAAGAMEFGDRRFDLRVPAALSTNLDLELPKGQRPSVSSDVLLTGPFPIAEDSSKSLWRFRFGGRSRLEFGIRSSDRAGATASASLTSRYELSPGQLSGAFEFDLRPAKSTVSEWQFLVDPGLRIVDVVVNNRSGWTLDPASQAGGMRLLHVFLNQPGNGGKVLVSALASTGDPAKSADSPLPEIRPQAAILDDESVEIRISPELKLEKSSPGDFRLVDSQFLPDQTHLLLFGGTLLQPGVDRVYRQAPGVATRLADPEFRTTEQIDWRLNREQSSVQLRLGIAVKRGPLFRVQVRTPTGYAFSRLLSPQDDLVSSAVLTAQGVTLEFKAPLLTGQGMDLALEFRGPRVRAGRYPIPVFSVMDSSEKVGVLGINPGAEWNVDFKAGVGLAPTSWLDFQQPLPPLDAALAFRYGGADPDGELTLVPIHTSFTAAITSARESERKRTTSRISLHVNSGAVSQMIVVEPNAGPPQRSWKLVSAGNALGSVSSLPLEAGLRQLGLLLPTPGARLGVLATLSSPSPGRLWLIRLARPATGELVFETAVPDIDSKTSRAGLNQRPVLQVLGAEIAEPPAETNDRRAESADSQPEWAFRGLYLITAIRSSSEMELIFGGTATASVAGQLPVRLPPGARILTSNVGGSWLNLNGVRLSPDLCVFLPVAAKKATRFEIRYELPTDPGVAAHIDSPAPVLPGGQGSPRRWWWFGNNVLPIWPPHGWGQGKHSDLPALLGPSPTIGPGTLASINSLSQVWVCSSRSAYVAGILLGTGLCLAVWMLGRHWQRTWWGGAIAAVFLLGVLNQFSDPWIQRATTIPLVVGLIALACVTLLRGSKSARGVTVSIFFLLAAVALAPAQAPAPAVVVLLPAEGDGVESVVTPKAVLDRLNALISPHSPGVVITSADYSVAVEETAARVTARYVIQSLSSTESVLALPLSDARLEQVRVDGNQAFPAVARPGVYTIQVPAGKRHEMEVHFAVSVLKIGPEREIRFGVPESPATHVVADLPGSARQVQCVGRGGKQSLTDGSPRRLDVDAGNVRAVYVRWRDGIAGTAAIKVREAYIWDIAEKGAELTACYLTRVEQGAVSGLRYELPTELEPVEISLRPVETTGTAALRDWSIATESNGVRTLRLDLQGPTTERMLVVLNCRLKKATTSQPLLRFPRPLIPGGNPEADAIFAIRTRDVANKVVIDSMTRSGLNEESADALLRDREWTRALDRRLDANSPMQVFRPAPNSNHELRPIIRTASEKPSVSLETSWQISANRAKVTGTIRWTGKEPLPLLEFTIPGVRVLEVNSPEVREWGAKSGRVSVWLNKPVAEGVVAWTGSLSMTVSEHQALNPAPLEIHSPHADDARVVSQTVRIRPADGWVLTLDRDRGWNRLTSPDWTYVLQSGNSGVPAPRVVIAPAPPDAKSKTSEERVVTQKRSPTPLSGPGDASSAVELPALASPLEAASDRASGLIPMGLIAAWTVAVGALVLLFLRAPGGAWPEQVGLMALMLGITVGAGYWWMVGIFGWFAARLLWLVQRNSRQRSPMALSIRHSALPE